MGGGWRRCLVALLAVLGSSSSLVGTSRDDEGCDANECASCVASETSEIDDAALAVAREFVLQNGGYARDESCLVRSCLMAQPDDDEIFGFSDLDDPDAFDAFDAFRAAAGAAAGVEKATALAIVLLVIEHGAAPFDDGEIVNLCRCLDADSRESLLTSLEEYFGDFYDTASRELESLRSAVIKKKRQPAAKKNLWRSLGREDTSASYLLEELSRGFETGDEGDDVVELWIDVLFFLLVFGLACATSAGLRRAWGLATKQPQVALLGAPSARPARRKLPAPPKNGAAAQKNGAARRRKKNNSNSSPPARRRLAATQEAESSSSSSSSDSDEEAAASRAPPPPPPPPPTVVPAATTSPGWASPSTRRNSQEARRSTQEDEDDDVALMVERSLADIKKQAPLPPPPPVATTTTAAAAAAAMPCCFLPPGVSIGGEGRRRNSDDDVMMSPKVVRTTAPSPPRIPRPPHVPVVLEEQSDDDDDDDDDERREEALGVLRASAFQTAPVTPRVQRQAPNDSLWNIGAASSWGPSEFTVPPTPTTTPQQPHRHKAPSFSKTTTDPSAALGVVASVKVLPLPPDVDDETLRRVFDRYGGVVGARAYRDSLPPHGYVDFSDRSAAVAAAFDAHGRDDLFLHNERVACIVRERVAISSNGGPRSLPTSVLLKKIGVPQAAEEEEESPSSRTPSDGDAAPRSHRTGSFP